MYSLVSRPLNRLSRDTFLRGRARPPITTNEAVNIVHQRITEFRSRKSGLRERVCVLTFRRFIIDKFYDAPQGLIADTCFL